MACSLQVVTPPPFLPLTLGEAKMQLHITDTADDPAILDAIATATEQTEKFLQRAIYQQVLRFTMDSFPDLPNATLKFFVPTYSVESYLARAISLMSGPIYLPRPPVQVGSITIDYIDDNGDLQTLDPSQYLVDYDAEPVRIAPAYSEPWPVTQAVQAAVKITYTAGSPLNDPFTTISGAIVGSSTPQAVTPASMAGIKIGSVLVIDTGASAEAVLVTALGSGTFTALFCGNHSDGCAVAFPPAIQPTWKSGIKLWTAHLYKYREPVQDKATVEVPMSIDRLLWMDRIYEIPAGGGGGGGT